MFKIQWDEVSDPFKHCYAICGDKESTYALYHQLTYGGTNDGCKPINICVFDLSGNLQDTNFWPAVQGELPTQES